MKKFLYALLATASIGMTSVALAHEDKITKGFKSYDAMGCMLLRECTDDVDEVFSLLDISSNYDNAESFTPVANEFNNMLMSLNQVGVGVYLADENISLTVRGMYHTVSNAFPE